MNVLRRERERRGVTLREVSRQTGIPTDILDALEAEERPDLVPGGFAARSLETYCRFLGVDPATLAPPRRPAPVEEAVEPTVTDPTGDRRLPVVRLVVSGIALVAIAGLFLWVIALLVDPPKGEEAAEAEPPPGHELVLRAIEPTRARVEVDGEKTFEGALLPAAPASFRSRTRISVYVPDLTHVRIVYDGREVQALGNLSSPRTLVFIDDKAP